MQVSFSRYRWLRGIGNYSKNVFPKKSLQSFLHFYFNSVLFWEEFHMASSSLNTEKLESILEKSEADDDGLTKQERILRLITKKKECDSRAKEIVLQFIDNGVTKEDLITNAALISPNHWEDIVEERKLSKICGWVLCDKELGVIPKKQYSIKNNKVYDITLRKSFCSGHCYAVSEHFKNQLLVSPLWLRDEEPTPEFEILEDESKQLHGINLSLNTLSLSDIEG